jgi:hypothetical protein
VGPQNNPLNPVFMGFFIFSYHKRYQKAELTLFLFGLKNEL